MPDKPNIIIIMADDMGYSDLGITGSEIATPNLDRMANEGVLFTHFYNTSRCCPSRASLLTGQYQWDAGMGHMTKKSKYPEYQGFLNDQSVTIAEVLRINGYQTFMGGKWHLGAEKREMWPDHRGFDQFYGTPSGGGIYFYPSKFYERPVYWNGVQVHPDSTWYSTDAFTDYSIDFIKDKRTKDQPFFMYLAYVAPHFPLQAKKEDINKYMDTYQVGYDEIRKNRFKRQQELGLVPENTPPSEPQYPAWDLVEDQESEAMEMAVYAAMVDRMDQNIGKLLTALEEEGVLENTVIFFLSDNGASQVGWNKTTDAELGTRNSNASYGTWYNVSNTPYRMHKTQEHEGGIITPMIMHWPEGIKERGQKITQPAHINDFMPTCLELAQATYPTDFNGKKLDPLDGETFLPLLENEETTSERMFFWEHEGNKAVRRGDWKLVALHKEGWELYNLNIDPFEMHNVIDDHGEKAKELELEYLDWADQHGVQTWPLKQ